MGPSIARCARGLRVRRRVAVASLILLSVSAAHGRDTEQDGYAKHQPQAGRHGVPGVPQRGEQSGHVIFMDHSTTGDGLITALLVLTVMVESGRPLSELRAMHRVPQVLENMRQHDAVPRLGDALVRSDVRRFDIQLERVTDDLRVLRK